MMVKMGEGCGEGGEVRARREWGIWVERVEGIEPSTKAWEAFVLPLNYTRITHISLLTKRGVL